MQDSFSMINKTGSKLPRIPFGAIKEDILGKEYSLSLAFVDKKTSQKINKKYRKKDKPTNVLSFSLSKKSGEIILTPALIKEESGNENKNFGKNFRQLLGFLVIHGMLHLKGHEHSSRIGRAKMERQEKKYDQKYFYRNRRGLINDQSRGGGISKRRKNS